MKLVSFSKQARQARSQMPRLTSAAAYAQMDSLMGRTGSSAKPNGNGRPSSIGLAPTEKSSR
jgi:hypothetical protein